MAGQMSHKAKDKNYKKKTIRLRANKYYRF